MGPHFRRGMEMEKRITDGIFRNSPLERVIEERGICKGNDKRLVKEVGRVTEECLIKIKESTLRGRELSELMPPRDLVG